MSLDAPVVRYLPDFVMADPAYRRITVRMLLDHSAGLPGSDYLNALTTTPFLGYGAQLLRGLAYARLKHVPGAMAVYCNDCVTLAGLVVERVSGTPFHRYVSERVLAPLGMTHTGFATEPFAAGTWAPVLVDGHPQPQEILNLHASGGAWSTPGDMARLAVMLSAGGTWNGRRVLSAASVRQMATGATTRRLDPAALQGYRFGLGWDTVAEPGLAAVGVRAWVKGGDSGDYHSSFAVAPDAGLAVILQAAGRAVSSLQLTATAQRILLHALVERGTLRAMPARLPVAGPASMRPSDASLRAIRGVYVRMGAPIRVSSLPDRSLVMSTLAGGAWTPLSGRWTLRVDGAWWSGSASIRAVTGWGRTFLVRRAPDGWGHYRTDVTQGQRITGDVTRPAWSARAGTVGSS